MKELRDTVQILIPVFNDIKDIDLTMQSILTQDFDRNNIYITAVDFGSTDGSYEKLMQYPSMNFSIYQYKGDFTKGTMPALASKFWLAPDGWQYQLLLMPGDVIYPQCLKRITFEMRKYRLKYPDKRLEMLVSEVDVRHEDGTVDYKAALRSDSCVLQFEENSREYFMHGYRKNVMCFGGKIKPGLHRHFSAENERIWWNRIALTHMSDYVVYLPDRLACIKERYYEDELGEILLWWEYLVLFIRKQIYQVEAARIEIDQDNMEKTLALYALWRSFVLKKKQDMKQAKECFQIASVIYPRVKKLPVYSSMKEFVVENKTQLEVQIEQLFEKE